jgi:hypothetical protein
MQRPLESLPDIDLAKLRTFAIRVVDASGAPASQAVVNLLPLSDTIQMVFRSEHVSILTDRAGRAELLCGDGDYAVSVNDASARVLTLLPAEQKGSELVLALQPLPKVRCRVVDDAGRPVRDARVVREKTLPGRAIRKREDWPQMRFAWWLSEDVLSRACSDAQGWIDLPIQDLWPCSEDIRLVAGPHRSSTFRIEAGADPGTIVVR